MLMVQLISADESRVILTKTAGWLFITATLVTLF